MPKFMSKNCVVLGGAGDVGEGIVRQLRAAGHTVAVPSRSKEKLVALDETTRGVGRLVDFVGSVSDARSAPDLAKQIEAQLGPIDLVVASVGSWWTGPTMLEMDHEDWTRILNGSQTSHFVVARAFLPLIRHRDGAQYVFINGGAARMPVPGSGPISVAAAAQEMMKTVFASELADDPVAICTLMLMTPVKTRSRQVDNPNWLSADNVGQYIVQMLSNPPENGKTILLRSPSNIPSLVV